MQEGSDAVLELAFHPADGLEYIEPALKLDFLSGSVCWEVVILWGIGMNFYMVSRKRSVLYINNNCIILCISRFIDLSH